MPIESNSLVVNCAFSPKVGTARVCTERIALFCISTSRRMRKRHLLRKNVRIVSSSFRNLGTNGRENEFLTLLLVCDKHSGLYSFVAANANKAIEYRPTPQEGSIRLVYATAGIGSFSMG